MNDHVRSLALVKVVGLNSKTNSSVTYSDENDLLVYSSGCVAVGYSPTQQEQTMYYQTPYKISCLKFSPNSRYLAIGTVGQGGGNICIFESESGRLAKTWRRKHRFGVACLDWSPDSKFLLTVGHRYDATVRVWNVEKDTTIASNNTSKRKIHNCSFSIDGKTFVTAGEGHFKFWRYSEASRVVTGRKCVLNELSDCCFSDVDNDKIRSNIFYSVTSNGRLCSFDNRSRTIKRCIELNTSTASSVCNEKDLLVVGCGNGLIRIFRTNELKYVATVPAIPSIDRIYGVERFDHNMEDEYLKNLSTVSVKLSTSKNIVFSVYSDKSIYVWDISNLEDIKVKKSYLSHAGCIWDVDLFPFQKKQSVLPNNTIATVGSDNSIRFWNFSSSDEEIRSMKSIARRNFFSKDMIYGKRIKPFCDATTASLTSLSSGKSNQKKISTSKKNINESKMKKKNILSKNAFGKDEELRCIKFSPRGEFFVVGDRSGVIRIFESLKFREIKSYKAHDSEVLSIDFQFHDHNTSTSPRGDLSQSYSSWDFANNLVPYLIVSGSRDRNINIFTFRPRKKSVLRHLLTLSDHTSTVTSVILTRKCRRLFSCSSDKTAIFRNIVKISDEVIQAHDYARSSFNSTLYDMVRVNYGSSSTSKKNNYVVVAGNHSLRLICSDDGKEVFTFESSSSSSSISEKKKKNRKKRGVGGNNNNNMNQEDVSTGIKKKKKNTHRFSSPITFMDSSTSLNLPSTTSSTTTTTSLNQKTNPYKVSVNGSGNLIAVSYTDRSIRLFELKRGTFLMKITSHSELVTGMCFTSDEKHLITMSLDGCMFIWRFSHPHEEYGKKVDLLPPGQVVMTKPKLVLPKSITRRRSNEVNNSSSSRRKRRVSSHSNIYQRNRKRLYLQQQLRRKSKVKKHSIIEPLIMDIYSAAGSNKNNSNESDDEIPSLIPKLSLRLEKMMGKGNTTSPTSSPPSKKKRKWGQKKGGGVMNKGHFVSKNQLQFDTNKLPSWLQKNRDGQGKNKKRKRKKKKKKNASTSPSPTNFVIPKIPPFVSDIEEEEEEKEGEEDDEDDELEEFGSRILNETNLDRRKRINEYRDERKSQIKLMFGTDFNVHIDGTQTARRSRKRRHLTASSNNKTPTTTTTKWKKKSMTPSLPLQKMMVPQQPTSAPPPSIEDYFLDGTANNGNSSYTIDENDEENVDVSRKLFSDQDELGDDDDGEISMKLTSSQNYIDSVRKMIEDLDKHEDIIVTHISDDEEEIPTKTTTTSTTTTKIEKEEKESSTSSSTSDDDDFDVSSLSEEEEEEMEKKKNDEKKDKNIKVLENGILMKNKSSPKQEVFIPRINLSKIKNQQQTSEEMVKQRMKKTSVINRRLLKKKKNKKKKKKVKKKVKKKNVMDPKEVLDEGDTRRLCVLFCQVVDKLLSKYDDKKLLKNNKKKKKTEEEDNILKRSDGISEDESEEGERKVDEDTVEVETIERLFEAYSRKLVDRNLIQEGEEEEEEQKKKEVRDNGSQTEIKMKEERGFQTLEKVRRSLGTDTADLGSYVDISMEERMDQNQLRMSLEKYSSLMMESVLMKLEQRRPTRSSAEKKKKRDRDSMK